MDAACRSMHIESIGIQKGMKCSKNHGVVFFGILANLKGEIVMALNFLIQWAYKIKDWFCITMFLIGCFSSWTLFQVKILKHDVTIGKQEIQHYEKD